MERAAGRILLAIGLIILFITDSSAQNIGVGTTIPKTRFHVSNGSSGHIGSYYPGILIENNSSTYLNLLTANASESGILFGLPSSPENGGIIYNNGGSLNGLQFRTNGNATRMTINNIGNVGIGNTLPEFPLHFSNLTGDKIALIGTASANYGFGIQIGVLQIHTDHAGSDIAFGYGNSISFTEKLRIKGTGAISINGITGNTGQVLQSNGNTSPSWKTMGAIIQTYYKYPPALISAEGTLDPGETLAFTALTHTINVSTKSRLIITGAFWGTNGSCIGCGPRTLTVDIVVNGNEVVPGSYNGVLWYTVDNGLSNTGQINNFFYDVNPGTYTIEFVAGHLGGGSIYLYSKYSTIIVLPID